MNDSAIFGAELSQRSRYVSARKSSSHGKKSEQAQTRADEGTNLRSRHPFETQLAILSCRAPVAFSLQAFRRRRQATGRQAIPRRKNAARSRAVRLKGRNSGPRTQQWLESKTRSIPAAPSQRPQPIQTTARKQQIQLLAYNPAGGGTAPYVPAPPFGPVGGAGAEGGALVGGAAVGRVAA